MVGGARAGFCLASPLDSLSPVINRTYDDGARDEILPGQPWLLSNKSNRGLELKEPGKKPAPCRWGLAFFL
jgi:hypothetical protein